ncbi:MAG: hypothetical protein Q7J79_01885, partial [Gemmatimonadales bacterium]|nr:hypothetical protein [Gemmatimonadales bacterium]
ALELEVVKIGENGVTERDIFVHDETNRTLASLLVSLQPPAFPVALGVIYHNPAEAYESDVYAQLAEAGAWKGDASLDALLRSDRTWTVMG